MLTGTQSGAKEKKSWPKGRRNRLVTGETAADSLWTGKVDDLTIMLPEQERSKCIDKTKKQLW